VRLIRRTSRILSNGILIAEKFLPAFPSEQFDPLGYKKGNAGFLRRRPQYYAPSKWVFIEQAEFAVNYVISDSIK